MMRMQPEQIALGQDVWTVRPLTVAQVQAIEPLVFAGRDGKSGNVAAAVGVLRVALSRDHADAAARLDELEAGADEIAAAMAQVLRLGGFLPKGTAPGEVLAGEATVSTGPRSTPA